MINHISRFEEEIVFDVNKIIAAVNKVLDEIAGIADAINEVFESFEEGLYTALHSFAHWVLQRYHVFKRWFRRAPCYNPALAMCLTIAIRTCANILILVCAVIACKNRTTFLLRTQDRGSSDPDNEDIFLRAVS